MVPCKDGFEHVIHGFNAIVGCWYCVVNLLHSTFIPSVVPLVIDQIVIEVIEKISKFVVL